MDEHLHPSTPRRTVLTAALGAIAALAASMVGRPAPARAAAGQAVIQGQVNAAGATATTVTATIAGNGAIVGQNANLTGRGLLGKATATTGANYGVYGQTASASGRGVFGRATKATGLGVGVMGTVTSPAGHGVYGKASTTVGSGAAVRADGQKNIGLDATTTEPSRDSIRAIHNGGAGNGAAIHAYGNSNIGLAVETAHQDNSAIVANHLGVAGTGAAITAYGNSNVGIFSMAQQHPIRAYAAGTNGIGIWSEVESGASVAMLARNYATSGDATCVLGMSDSVAARVIVGNASAVSGLTHAVYGTSPSTAATVIKGEATASTGAAWGVQGVSASASGTGVYGVASAGSGTTYGVFGASSSSSGYGVYSSGNAHVSGTLSKSAGSFKIDHPLDPAGMYLSHSFVESPDMKNVYDGVATADHRGEATVELPAYFDALNRDLRYQLTPIGRHAPVFIKVEVARNRFVIGGADPGQRISWQVTGSRKDAYAEAHPIIVEEAKTGDASGRYLHPELHGQPANLAVHQRPDLTKDGHAAS